MLSSGSVCHPYRNLYIADNPHFSEISCDLHVSSGQEQGQMRTMDTLPLQSEPGAFQENSLSRPVTPSPVLEHTLLAIYSLAFLG